MSDKANLVKWIEEALEKDETIEAVAIGEIDGWKESKASPVSWEEAKKILDYDFDSGYGGAQCHAIYAWTNKRVFFISEYDGSTRLNWLPRNPTITRVEYG